MSRLKTFELTSLDIIPYLSLSDLRGLLYDSCNTNVVHRLRIEIAKKESQLDQEEYKNSLVLTR